MYIPLIIFILMLIFPNLTKTGAYNGLMLWFNTIIPTLLPYMIISGIICYFNAFNIVSTVLYPITKRVFGISRNANYCLIIGFLCGYPMGSKVIADMLQDEQIDYNEAAYLLSFCNNISPSFLINYVASAILLNCYKIDNHCIHIVYFIIFASPIIVSFIYRLLANHRIILNTKSKSIRLRIASTDSSNSFLDKCILNSFDNIFKIGGYIIIFSIISTWILNTKILNKNFAFILSAFFEITSGLYALKHTSFSSDIGILLVTTLCSFGGVCSIAQTYSMIAGTSLKTSSYVKYKLLNAVIAFILTIILI